MTVRGLRELAALPLGPIPGAIREHSRALLKLLDEQIRGLDLELSHRWGDDPRVRRLTTIPGIGPFVAILLVLELGEIRRFPSAKHVAIYVGLTPRVRATATTVRLWATSARKGTGCCAGHWSWPRHRRRAVQARCARGSA